MSMLVCLKFSSILVPLLTTVLGYAPVSHVSLLICLILISRLNVIKQGLIDVTLEALF